ncbi:hypothetical protein IGB42_03215 [Andreprevotia sp. IGB-42]|uniref:hypothetical protein n=1 Tax=Andreprevotia sp. IGB-42 TaxID=2497473 RepID=UPI001359432E|nr:hypothetical protein [Andreprevotia sp. IGB-42]KAF0812225.1 hypothetical protein IGB42_03215 [Andreprevotia sp. IGB-42]
MYSYLRGLFLSKKEVASEVIIPKPWDADRQSIYQFLNSFPREKGKPLPDEAGILPDEAIVHAKSGNGMRWASGAMDGAFGHHAGSAPDQSNVDAIYNALHSATLNPSAANIKTLYILIADDNVLNIADALLSQICVKKSLPLIKLQTLTLWLARESPDRGAVKLAVALLGMFSSAADIDLLMTLGLHEEFTLFAAVALGNALEESEAEAAWWELAKCVDGWGRIHLVERLAQTKCTGIQNWLLREGYANSVMHEYLAYDCAVGGNLEAALGIENIDDALLLGAGDIIQALINGGPAQDMTDYEGGAAVIQLYLGHLQRSRIRSVEPILAAQAVIFFIEQPREWEVLEAYGWKNSARQRIVDSAKEILKEKHWALMVQDQLQAEDSVSFWSAARAAEVLGDDPWEQRFCHQQNGRSEQWYDLMRTDDANRVQRVIDLAVKQLDLEKIATGPAAELGLGPDYRCHTALDFILQSLDRFPGLGWGLIDAGLRSPVTRNRNMALRALAGWGQANWPANTKQVLEAARSKEPESRVKENIENVLAGREMA